MSIITLTTDFGASDGYVGTMKGVILSIAPNVTLVDITHEIAPQHVRQAAFVLHAAASYFPPGTIHLAVVDPGVGSRRRALVVRTSRGFLVGPDNGLFTLFLADEPDAECHSITNPAFMLPHVSATFHGRDVFAPVAAHLARRLDCSAELSEFGPRVSDPATLTIPKPVQQSEDNWLGQVLFADHFGNLITSITADVLTNIEGVEILIGQTLITGIKRTFADAAPGELIALVGSSGHLEISIANGNAAQSLDLGPDSLITLRKMQDA
jgi:S-adenosylmethionine hydrolase